MEELHKVVPHFLLDRAEWKLTASHNEETLNNAVDNFPSSRYDTRLPQVPGMWLEIALPEETVICGILLDAATSMRTFPRGFEVELSRDVRHWSLAATGEGNAATTEIRFEPRKAQYIRITLTQVAHEPWSIHDLWILKPPDAD